MDYTKLAVSIVLCLLAGGIGSIFTAKSIPTWYKDLKKPSFNPPNWIFGPVWTTLYILMGISAYLVWTSGWNSAVKVALAVFAVQLILNTAWSIIFFGLQNPFVAFVEIIFMWLAIFATIVLFYRISPTAAYLLVPYLLWVSFASALNFAIWRLN
jgi:tryptophan-rich sensory protein